jgi:hypothetical protein
MAGERKSLSSLVGTADPAPTPRPSRPDRADGADKDPRADGGERPPLRPAPLPPPPVRGPATNDMTMRSWYMPKASADRLAALIDDVHFATRLPKNLIMGAVVNVIDRHRAEVEAEARSAGGA